MNWTIEHLTARVQHIMIYFSRLYPKTVLALINNYAFIIYMFIRNVK